MDNSSQNNQYAPQPQPPQPTPPPYPQQPYPQQPVPQQPIVGVPTPYQMPPKKGLSKGAIWGIISGVIGVILVVVAVVLAVVLLGGPSEADYTAMQTQLKDAKSQRQQMNKNIKPYMEGLLDGEVSGSKLKDSLTAYKASIDKLKDMKATKDADVKAAYDELIKEHDEIVAYVESILSIEEKAEKAYELCDGSGLPSDTDFSSAGKVKEFFTLVKSLGKECSEALSELSNTKSKELNNYFKGIIEIYEEQVDLADGVIAALGGTENELLSALTEFAGQAEKISSETVELSENIMSEVKQYDQVKKITSLEEVINKKLK